MKNKKGLEWRKNMNEHPEAIANGPRKGDWSNLCRFTIGCHFVFDANVSTGHHADRIAVSSHSNI